MVCLLLLLSVNLFIFSNHLLLTRGEGVPTKYLRMALFRSSKIPQPICVAKIGNPVGYESRHSLSSLDGQLLMCFLKILFFKDFCKTEERDRA